jgi:hypothetical protein
MVTIQGVDVSRYQGTIDWNKLYANGGRFAGIRFSQGIGYADTYAEANCVAAKAAGVKIFPYHFCTTDNAITQANWFKKCMGNIVFDLPPALDVEYYTPTMQSELDHNELYGLPYPEVFPELRFRYDLIPMTLKQMNDELRTLVIPTQSIVDVICRQLANFQGFPTPVIYTNASSGNAVFTNSSMSKYPLWIANWTTADKPYLPAIWKTKGTYIIWQKGVVDGTPWGTIPNTKIDWDVWGNEREFPGTPTNEITGTIYIKELDKTLTLREA